MSNGFVERNRREAFTLVELLVVIAIIGVMVGLLLPAVQAAREAARRMSCSNNLKQIGLAIHMYHDTYNAIPPAYFAQADALVGTAKPASWIVRILPFMEQTAAYEQTDFSTDFSNRVGVNRNWRAYHRLIVPTIICPSSPLPVTRLENATAGTVALGAPAQLETQMSNYIGVSGQYNFANMAWWNGYFGMADYNGVMIPVDMRNPRPLKFSSILDGTTNTIAVGEQANFKTVIAADGSRTTFDDRSSNFNGGAWSGGGGRMDPTLGGNFADTYRMNVASIRVGMNFTPIQPITDRNNPWGTGPNGGWPGMHYSFNSAHTGGVQFVKMDGSVQFITDNIKFSILQNLANRTDKNVLEEF
jgi:prepilin-type N-terminal cleavage/methylation domain-containing protein